MKIRTTVLLETVIAICIILNCECIWKWMHHSGYFILALDTCYIVSLFYLVGHGGIVIQRVNIKTINSLCIILFGYTLFNIFINSSRIVDTLFLVVTIILMALYIEKYERLNCILVRCSTILCFLAVMSLFFWLFGSVLHLFSPNQSLVVYNSNVPHLRQSYFYLHYEVQTEELLGGRLYRNTGIFYEGPKYALLLALFLMYELFVSKEPNYKRCIIFTITAFTTMAMTGMYAILLIWGLYFLCRFPALSLSGLILRIGVVLFLFVFGVQVITYFEDMLTLKAGTASYKTRMDNYLAGFLAWKEHPFMGAGYLNMSTIQNHYSSIRLNDLGYSNSVFRLLAQGGLYLSIIYIVPIVKAIKASVASKNWYMISYVLIFIYFFITTSFTYNYVMYLILGLMYFGTVNMNFIKKTGD